MSKASHTINSLRLNLDEAMAGRTWLLLPEGFRDHESAKVYPLPTHRDELHKLAIIHIRPHKKDSGSIYLRRALVRFRERMQRMTSAALDVGERTDAIRQAHGDYKTMIGDLRKEARMAVDEVRAEARQAIASLDDLFSLGRKGIEGMMRAHLDGEKWKDEEINARAFRECFRMVTQAVKGLGLPSDQKDAAQTAIIEQYAASLEATRETVALAPGAPEMLPAEPETEH